MTATLKRGVMVRMHRASQLELDRKYAGVQTNKTEWLVAGGRPARLGCMHREWLCLAYAYAVALNK